MFKTLTEVPFKTAAKYPERVSYRYREGSSLTDITYKKLTEDIQILTSGLFSYGIKEGDHVAFFVNNRYEWILSDFALLGLAAVSVPRGSDTPPSEASFIFHHSDSVWAILETVSQLQELADISDEILTSSGMIFIIEEGDLPAEFSNKVVFFSDVMKKGKENELDYMEYTAGHSIDSVATIIYTSGTTGNPKGVMLSQRNFLQQLKMVTPRLQIDESIGEVAVTILPSWHVLERALEYVGLSAGVSFVYSSIKDFAEDIQREQPHFLVSVPRIWDSIYFKMNKHLQSISSFKRVLFNFFLKINQNYKSCGDIITKSYIRFTKEGLFHRFGTFFIAGILKIVLFPLHLLADKMFAPVRARVGGRLRCAITAGGSMPMGLDRFYSSVGITLLNSYGMTECAPGITSREFEKNTLGSIGNPFLDTQVKVLCEDGSPAGIGERGFLYAKGPQVMQGYYKNVEATKAVLSDDGWLLTGDIVKKTVYGDYVFYGRSKDTIVLFGGENVDPTPIEDKLKECALIDHAVLLGQDAKNLTAFIAINEESLIALAETIKFKVSDVFSHISETCKLKNENVSESYTKLINILKTDIDKLITRESGFKPFEKVSNIILVENGFKIGQELTQTLKIKRKQIEERYSEIISFFLKKAY